MQLHKRLKGAEHSLLHLRKKYLITQKRKKQIIHTQFTNDVPYEPDFDNPKTFNEKLQWLKLNYRDELFTICADKFKVRDYVQNKISSDILNKLHGVYRTVEEIDFGRLPEKFVLKSNNGSNTNIICNRKSSLDIEQTRKTLREWLDPFNSHYFHSFEWGYKHIKPRIICEEYLEDTENTELIDYKFFCFNGTPKLVLVASNRSTDLRIDFFDPDWTRLDITKTAPNHRKKPTRPKNFEKMIKIAEELSSPFQFVRVDLYNISGNIRFGELTFYPDNGVARYEPLSWDREIGRYLALPDKTPLIKRVRLGSKLILRNMI